MKWLGYAIKLVIKKMQEFKLEDPIKTAYKIFSEIEYYSRHASSYVYRQYECSPAVLKELEKVAKEDYLEHVGVEGVEGTDESEMTFYPILVIETKPNGNVVFVVKRERLQKSEY